MSLTVERSDRTGSLGAHGLGRVSGGGQAKGNEVTDDAMEQLKQLLQHVQQGQQDSAFNQGGSGGAAPFGVTSAAPRFGGAAPVGSTPLRSMTQGQGAFDMSALRNFGNAALDGFNKVANNVKDIFKGFSQGKEGNCVSVAWMKAAMAKFGTRADQVFSKVEKDANGGYKITMRDGKQVSLTAQEMETAKKMSNFKGTDKEMMEQAHIIYAAMAKRAQMENNDGTAARSFAAACHSLNDGEQTREGAHWLGLDKHVKSIPPGQAKNVPFAVGASTNHAVFIGGGGTDHYGTKSFNGGDTNGKGLIQAFTLV